MFWIIIISHIIKLTVANQIFGQSWKNSIIYVDNDSTDKSIKIASQYTENIYSVTADWATPGLTRNKGLEVAKHDIIHFLDGDIEIDRDYIKNAVEFLKTGKAEAYFGYLRERDGGLNKVLLSHWANKEKGFVVTSGGGGTYLKKPLMQINGYDERIRKGQEIEMGERFLQSGYKIWFEPIPMGIHNYGVGNLAGLFRIPYVAGRSMFYNSLLSSTSNFVKGQKKMSKKNFIFNAVFYISIILVLYSVYPILVFGILFILYQLFYLLKKNAFKDSTTLKYFLINSTYRFVIFFGQLSVLINIYILKKLSKPKKKMIINA